MPAEQARPLFLALDQGGHASRALVFDARGALLAKGLREVPVHHPRPTGWNRIRKKSWRRSAKRFAMRCRNWARGPRTWSPPALRRSAPASCVGIASPARRSHRSSAADRRAHAWLTRFAPHADAIHASTGLMLSAHYGASKLRWCLDHLPAVTQAGTEGRLAFGPLASFLVSVSPGTHPGGRPGERRAHAPVEYKIPGLG